MTGPNTTATAESVANKIDGIENGQPLPYDLVDMLAPSQIFSLPGTAAGVAPYAYPEGRNTAFRHDPKGFDVERLGIGDWRGWGGVDSAGWSV